MTTVSSTFTDVGVSSVLSVPQKGETISVAISGTYVQTLQLERAITPDESAWEVVLGPWSTEDLTVAENYVTMRYNEKFRLRCTSDTSGTSTYSFGDGDMLLRKHVDDLGNILAEWYQTGPRFPNAAVALTATASLNRAAHAGRHLAVSVGASNITLKLPAATGSGDRYSFYVVANATPSDLIIDADTDGGSDLQGVLALSSDIAGVSITSAVADNTLTMNGTTSGGLPGTWVECIDIAAGVYAVTGGLAASGAESDPWS